MYSNTNTRIVSPLHLVPVIDLAGGRAVHAVRGARASYRPLATAWSRAGDALGLAAGYVERFQAKTLYIADLDAITARGEQLALVAAIAARLPGIDLWVDAGFRDPATLRRWRERLALCPVIGSETLPDPALLADPAAAGGVLSLDFRHGRLLGPPALVERVDLWPADLILMALDRVGAGEGPDLARLAEIGARAPGRRLYSAGGVRDAADLERLAHAGASGALLATALHRGALG